MVIQLTISEMVQYQHSVAFKCTTYLYNMQSSLSINIYNSFNVMDLTKNRICWGLETITTFWHSLYCTYNSVKDLFSFIKLENQILNQAVLCHRGRNTPKGSLSTIIILAIFTLQNLSQWSSGQPQAVTHYRLCLTPAC